MESKRDRMIALCVLAGAFLLRLVFILQTRHLSLYYHPVADAGFFHQWATFKTGASWFDLTPPFREPLYAYFVASVYALIRESLTAVRLVQAALGAVTALMIYSIARAAYGRAAGIAAGAVFALSTSSIFFAGELGESCLLVFLLVASAYLVHRAWRALPYLNCAFSGLLLGAAFLTGAASAVALPAWMIGLLASGQARLRRASLLVLAGFLVLPAAYQVFLVKASEHPVLPLRTAWYAFLGSGAVGGTAEQERYDIALATAQGDYRATANADWLAGQKDALRFAGIERGEPLSHGASAAHWRQRAWDDLASRPARYLGNYFTKLGIFWGASEPPASIDSRYAARHSFLLKSVLFSFAVIAALGIVGVLRRGYKLLGLALFLPLYSLAASVLLVTDADKAVVIPFLAIFGGAAIGEAAERFRDLRVRGLLTYAAAVAIPLAAILLLPRSPNDQARQVKALGDIAREEALFDKAEASYLEAIEISPDYAQAYVSLSKVYSGAWKTDQALAVIDRAPGQAASDPALVIEKASLLLLLGRPAEAVAAARPLEATYPFEPRLHEVLGLGLLALGAVQEASEHLGREIEYSGGSFAALAALGEARMAQGQYAEAAGYLEQAMRVNSSNSGAAMHLADAYNKMGQHLKACEMLSRVLSKDPGNAPLRFKFANSLYKAGRLADAAEHFNQLIGFDPRNADVLVNLGTVYAAMDSTALAVEMWKRALLVDPANQLAADNLKEAGKPR